MRGIERARVLVGVRNDEVVAESDGLVTEPGFWNACDDGSGPQSADGDALLQALHRRGSSSSAKGRCAPLVDVERHDCHAQLLYRLMSVSAAGGPGV